MPPATSLLDWIHQHYPGQDPKQIFAELAADVLGPLPPYSHRKSYQISPVTRLMPGSFAIAYGANTAMRGPDGRMGEPVVVLQRRGDTGLHGEPRYGALGGFTNVDDVPEKGVNEEQPREGAAREISEELVDDTGKSLWHITPDRLSDVLVVGHDYRRKENGVCYTGFALELTPQELSAAQAHAKRLAADSEYAGKCRTASGGEVASIMVMPLREAIALSRASFTHPHEHDALMVLNQKLQAAARAHEHGIIR